MDNHKPPIEPFQGQMNGQLPPFQVGPQGVPSHQPSVNFSQASQGFQGPSVYLQPISIPNSPFPVCYIPVLMNPNGFMINSPAPGGMATPSFGVSQAGLQQFGMPGASLPHVQSQPSLFGQLNHQMSFGNNHNLSHQQSWGQQPPLQPQRPQPIGTPVQFATEKQNYRPNKDFAQIVQEARQEARFEVRQEPRVELRQEPRPELRSEVRQEPRPEIKPEIKPEVRPDTRPEPPQDSRPSDANNPPSLNRWIQATNLNTIPTPNPNQSSLLDTTTGLLTGPKDQAEVANPLTNLGIPPLKPNANTLILPHLFSGPPCLQNTWRDETFAAKNQLKKVSEGISEPDFPEGSVLEIESRTSCLDVSQEIRIPLAKPKRDVSQESMSVSLLPNNDRPQDESPSNPLFAATARSFMELPECYSHLKFLSSEDRVRITSNALDEALNRYDSLPDTQEIWKTNLAEKLATLHAVVRAIFLCEDGAKVEKLIAVSKRVPLLVFLNSRTNEPRKNASVDSLDVDDFNPCSSSLGLFERKRRRDLVKYAINWALEFIQSRLGEAGDDNFYSRYSIDETEPNGWNLDQFVRPILRRKQTPATTPRDRDFILRLFASQKFIRDARTAFGEFYYERQYKIINFKIGKLFRRLLQWLTKQQSNDQIIEVKLQSFLKNSPSIFPWTILQILEARESIKQLLPPERQQIIG